MGVRNLQGTPWHLESLHLSENDERRYKGRCKFYNYDNKNCSLNHTVCNSTRFCRNYIAISEEEFKQRQNKSRKQNTRKRKEEGIDDCYWY